MRMQKIAKIISWVSCGTFLFWTIYSSMRFGFYQRQLIIFAIPLCHAVLLGTKKYVAAFRVAIGEIWVFVVVLYVLLCFPAMRPPGIVSFPVAQVMWFIGGSILAVAGWVCHKAIIEIKNGQQQR